MEDEKCSVVNCQKYVKKGEYIVMDGDVFCEKCARLLLAEERNVFRVINLTKKLAELSKE